MVTPCYCGGDGLSTTLALSGKHDLFIPAYHITSGESYTSAVLDRQFVSDLGAHTPTILSPDSLWPAHHRLWTRLDPDRN
ncbi:hypothetical protein AFLA_002638 [Aspergillus flavus NRRL3357]|nr:hypothetical protein AFLA_002638 [Aspergillus flavus NRRL3357]